MEVTIIDPKEFGIEEKQAESIVSKLNQIVFERVELFEEYEKVVELDAETTSSEVFKKLRLSISNNRTKQLEPARKADKELFLRGGQFVDARYNREITENQRREAVLLEKEKHNENLQKQKAKDLNDARIERLRPYGDFELMNFAEFSEEDFDDYLLGKKTRFENAQKEAEAEALRIEAEKLEAIETNRRQLAIAPYLQFSNTFSCEISELSLEEFEVLLSECQQAKIEFDKKQAEIEKENDRLRKEAEVIAKELQDKKDAELKAENDRLAKEKELAKAPIKKQLEVWVNDFQLPECTVYNATSKEITEKFEAFKKWSINQINNL